MNLLQTVKEYVERGASQEEMQDTDYAQKRIDALSNFGLLQLLAEVDADLEAQELD